MADTTVEAELRRVCDLILQGDFMTAMNVLTPEAMNEAMVFAGNLAGVPLPESYVVEAQEAADGDHRFRISFHTAVRDVDAYTTWREIDGIWRVTRVEVPAA